MPDVINKCAELVYIRDLNTFAQRDFTLNIAINSFCLDENNE